MTVRTNPSTLYQMARKMRLEEAIPFCSNVYLMVCIP